MAIYKLDSFKGEHKKVCLLIFKDIKCVKNLKIVSWIK